jgi:hypothetical protein
VLCVQRPTKPPNASTHKALRFPEREHRAAGPARRIRHPTHLSLSRRRRTPPRRLFPCDLHRLVYERPQPARGNVRDRNSAFGNIGCLSQSSSPEIETILDWIIPRSSAACVTCRGIHNRSLARCARGHGLRHEWPIPIVESDLSVYSVDPFSTDLVSDIKPLFPHFFGNRTQRISCGGSFCLSDCNIVPYAKY